jgi:site-specific recombinase XerD
VSLCVFGTASQAVILIVVIQRGAMLVKQASKVAGITKEVCVHTLQHTFATHLLEDGLDIITLKNLLGHENIETTMDFICTLLSTP